MSDVNLPDYSIYEPTTSEQHPPVTMPQGTQARGVDAGHEHRDINVRSIFAWFFVLTVVVVVTYVILYGMYQLLEYFEQRKDRVASPIFSQRTPPPPPRLLPNPLDSELNPQAPMLGPGEFMILHREQEDERMSRIGLQDPTFGQGRIPRHLVDAVAKEGTPQPQVTDDLRTYSPQAWPFPPQEGLMRPLPSDPSGGRMLENGLR
ncbi:MAG: hypothetical protein KY468_00180 [Armatimonadetes bacterium]|nr:hypothetical protein [Armatimonadota bacterium]